LLPTLQQAIADVRRARDAVVALPVVDSVVGVQGTGLSGFVTATVAGLDDGSRQIRRSQPRCRHWELLRSDGTQSCKQSRAYFHFLGRWGAAASIVVSAVIPITYLVLQQNENTTEWATKTIGPNYSGIAAFVLSAVAMVVGSLLRSFLRPDLESQESHHA